MIIRNKYLGITNEDIRIEKDSIKLRQWLIDIEENISCMEIAINQAKNTAYTTGVFSDRSWFEKINTAVRLQKILKIEIEKRLDELKNNPEYILELIKRIRESHPSMTEVFTKGSCIRLYFILKHIYPTAIPYTDENHVITKIEENFYDITGKVDGTKYLPLNLNYKSVMSNLLEYDTN